MAAATISFATALLQIPAGLWFNEVNREVPKPYLDEVFHIRQAQAYWGGNWTTWDPKITTPPGLYLASIFSLKVLEPFVRFVGEWEPIGATVFGLRGFNYLILTLLLPLRLATLLRAIWQRNQGKGNFRQEGQIAHIALNICLFPVLFFFGALYYTDVYSVITVLGTCYWHQRQAEAASAISIWNLLIVLNGLLSLSLRQTNIFWVAIYLGGLEVVRELGDSGRRNQDIDDVFVEGWAQGLIYDPSVEEAGFGDYVNSAASIVIAAASSLSSVLPTLWPYLTLLASFAAFIAWNGGVVLGDKDNHIASLHLAQMLYIWPYIIFFSWPLILPRLLEFIRSPRPFLRTHAPRPLVSALILSSMLLVVHFNTVIHPFTLADNRHYMFYVFRILCLRHPTTKYLAVPIYFLCAWLALATLSPLTTSSPPSPSPTTKASSNSPATPRPPPSPQYKSLPTSHLLIYLTSTALSLCTAPLVEPRYFILPWIIWRLHVPPSSIPSATLLLETAWFLVVNAVTGWMFLYRGFEWPQEPGEVQRFMW